MSIASPDPIVVQSTPRPQKSAQPDPLLIGSLPPPNTELPVERKREDIHCVRVGWDTMALTVSRLITSGNQLKLDFPGQITKRDEKTGEITLVPNPEQKALMSFIVSLHELSPHDMIRRLRQIPADKIPKLELEQQISDLNLEKLAQLAPPNFRCRFAAVVDMRSLPADVASVVSAISEAAKVMERGVGYDPRKFGWNERAIEKLIEVAERRVQAGRIPTEGLVGRLFGTPPQIDVKAAQAAYEALRKLQAAMSGRSDFFDTLWPTSENRGALGRMFVIDGSAEQATELSYVLNLVEQRQGFWSLGGSRSLNGRTMVCLNSFGKQMTPDGFTAEMARGQAA